MADPKVVLSALDWMKEVGVPPDLIEAAKNAFRDAASVPPLPAVQADAAGGGAAQRVAERIEVSPSEIFLAPGESTSLAAERIYSSGGPDYVTSDVVWSAAGGWFEVDAKGLVSAKQLNGKPEKGEIIAFDRETQLRGTAVAWVNVPDLVIEPATFEIAPGKSVVLKAMLVYPGGHTTNDITFRVTWTASQPIVSLDSRAVATAAGITGEQTVTITATDSVTNLFAEAVATVKLPDDLTLEVTPAVVELAPGGSVRFLAERVDANGRLDVTKEVFWTSPAGSIVSIDRGGVATADPHALKSEQVDITVFDLGSERTVVISVRVKVPSRNVEFYKTPFTEVAFFDGYEGIVRPRLELAVRAFKLAEKNDFATDDAYGNMLKTKEKFAKSLKDPVGDVRQNDLDLKPDAMSAESENLSEDELRDFAGTVQQLIDDIRVHVTEAEARLKGKKDTAELHELQEEAKELDDDIELVARSVKVLVGATEGHPAELFNSLVDVGETIAKRMNPKTKEAKEKQKILDDADLERARTELDNAEKSRETWLQKHDKTMELITKRAKHADEHWGTVEKKFDRSPSNKGGFRFEDVGKIMSAAKDTRDAALRSADTARIAEQTAEDLVQNSPKPYEWLAHPDKDLPKLQTLRAEAIAKGKSARAKQAEAEALIAKMSTVVGQARKAMTEPDPDEP